MKNKLIILLILATNFLYSMQKTKPKGHTIIKEKYEIPKEYKEEYEKIIKQFNIEQDTNLGPLIIGPLFPRNEKKMQDAYQKLSQDFYISECTDIGCSLVRSKYPDRSQFESKLFKYIESNLSKKKPIVYTSFGSGFLFQDLVILANLIKRGYKKIHINLIDKLYLSQSKSGREDRAEQAIKNFADMIHYVPGTDITIRIYNSTSDYLEDIKNKYAQISDILISIDTKPDFDFCKNKQLPLLQKGLKNNGIYASLQDEECIEKKEAIEKNKKTLHQKEPIKIEKPMQKKTAKKIEEMTEKEQIQEAIRRSMQNK